MFAVLTVLSFAVVFFAIFLVIRALWIANFGRKRGGRK